MGFINTGGFLMRGGGFAFSRKCCCSGFHCYCYVRYINYGSTLVERRIVCYREPVWDGSKWVFPDGQPCWPTTPTGCSVNYLGLGVDFCSCSGGGNPFGWYTIASEEARASCTTISPAP